MTLTWLLVTIAGGATSYVVCYLITYHWVLSGRRVARPRAVPAPTRPVMPIIAARDADDPFCTCPKCGLLGNHAVEIRHQSGIRRVPDGHGDWIEIGMVYAPPPGPYAHRTCWSCGHEWRTKA